LAGLAGSNFWIGLLRPLLFGQRKLPMVFTLSGMLCLWRPLRM